jgi:anti-sigma factor RsiW
LNCEAFLDRLYDNDARAAGRGLGGIPPDMAAHMLACDRCRAEYHAAQADDLLLTRALLDVPPPAWLAETWRQITRSPRTSWSQRIASVNEIVIWGVLAVAASQIALGESSTAAYVAAFGAGGAAALLRSSMAKHWQLLRRPHRIA